MEVVARWADTPVRAIQIQTSSCATCAWIHCTFINISTLSAVQSELIAIVAHTQEGAHGVHTLAISTHAPLSRTLIDIYAVTVV